MTAPADRMALTPASPPHRGCGVPLLLSPMASPADWLAGLPLQTVQGNRIDLTDYWDRPPLPGTRRHTDPKGRVLLDTLAVTAPPLLAAFLWSAQLLQLAVARQMARTTRVRAGLPGGRHLVRDVLQRWVDSAERGLKDALPAAELAIFPVCSLLNRTRQPGDRVRFAGLEAVNACVLAIRIARRELTRPATLEARLDGADAIAGAFLPLLCQARREYDLASALLPGLPPTRADEAPPPSDARSVIVPSASPQGDAPGDNAVRHETTAEAAPPSLPDPRWDKATRTLWYGEQLLHRYERHPAQVQTRLLDLFQDANWLEVAPIPADLHARLSNGVKNLNHTLNRHGPSPIRFRRNGNGRSARWERVGNGGQ